MTPATADLIHAFDVLHPFERGDAAAQLVIKGSADMSHENTERAARVLIAYVDIEDLLDEVAIRYDNNKSWNADDIVALCKRIIRKDRLKKKSGRR